MGGRTREDYVTVHTSAGKSNELLTAARRLETALKGCPNAPEKAGITVRLDHSAELGEEGYSIRSESPDQITISGATGHGAANGIYALLHDIRAGRTHPFGKQWDLTELPRWAERRVFIASFGMGLSTLTPDTWTADEWKQYIDFCRSFNVNRFTVVQLRHYHPDHPETLKEKIQLDVLREMIRYAHSQGIKVNILVTHNTVPTKVFWDHPEWRTDQIPGYFGHALCWSKASDVTLKYLKANLDYLDELDGVEVMVTEPLGWCLCDQCINSTKEIWVEAVEKIRSIIRSNNPDAEIVFWNWLTGYLPALKGVYPPTDRISDLDQFQPYVLSHMPQDTVFMDVSTHQIRSLYGRQLDTTGLPDVLVEAVNTGHRSVNFLFYSDIEFGMVERLSIFPQPFLDYTIAEMQHTKTLPVSGVCSYRLAPAGRFLSDYFTFRLAWNPDFPRESLLRDVAGFLTKNSKESATVIDAIEAIEAYWNGRRREDLITARDAFTSLDGLTEEGSGIATGLQVMVKIDEYARIVSRLENEPSAAERRGLERERETMLFDVYQTMKQYPLYQGFTSDGYWEPRSIETILRPAMKLWAHHINHVRSGEVTILEE